MRLFRYSFFTLFVGALTACGGSGSSSSISGKVIDGYIQGAQVCLDINNNMSCDSDEPSTTTSADGSYSFRYAGDIAGKHVLAIVGIGAIDSDSGAVTAPYNLLAPAESPKTVTPLSTLVSHEMISIGATASEASANIKAAFKFTQDPLNYDFKALNDDDTLKVAQAIASSIAMVNDTMKNDATAASGMSSAQMMRAAIKEVKDSILPNMIKSDGKVDAPACHPKCKQSELTAHISNKAATELSAISGRIQTIVSESKSGNGSVVSFKDVFTEGLAALSFRSGDYYSAPNTVLQYNNALKAEIYTLTNAALTRVSKVMVNDNWFTHRESQSDFVTLWDGEKWLEFIDDSDFGGTPVVEGNCVALVKSGSDQKLQKACILSKDLSGKKMNDVFPEICKNNGADILNCDKNIALPTGSYGYEMGFQSLKLNIEFSIDSNRAGMADSLEDFVNQTIATSPQYIGDNSNICFYFSKTTATSGTVRWAESKSDCQNINTRENYFQSQGETTKYVIETIGGKPVMVADVPSIFKKLNPRGLQYGCKIAFAAVKNINGLTDSHLGVEDGDYCEANTRTTIPFNGDTKNGMQFINLKLFNFLLLQRGLPAFPS